MSDLKSPNVFHPTRPSAVGSRNSLAQGGRDQKHEYDQLLNEEVESVLKVVHSKLPQEVLAKLDVMGGLKEKVYNYFNQNYQNMFNRFIVTAEDEMVKKVRQFVDKEELKSLARYSPKEVAELLDQVGGADKFNTGETEKSIVNMYGHLQGHIHRGMNDLENETNALLRQKADVGAFIRGENAYSIVKCAFKDSKNKPKTVFDVKLSINILDSELISPIFHYQTTVETIIKNQISKTIMDLLDHEIETWQDRLVDEGNEEPNDTMIMFEKIKRVPDFTNDDKDSPDSVRYSLMAKDLVDKIEGLRAEIDPSEFDPQNIRETIKRIIDIENIRNRGFNTAINNLTSILDTSKMGYQYIENMKNARELVVREYEDMDADQLPDERFAMNLKYYDHGQLLMLREKYDEQIAQFRMEIQRVYDVVEVIYQSNKKGWGYVNDFDDLAAKTIGAVRKLREEAEEQPYEEQKKTWKEISEIPAKETEFEELNRTYLYEKDLLKKTLRAARKKVRLTFGYENPKTRVELDRRIDFLEAEFINFDYSINPYHIQPGLILDVDITSIKRKRYVLGSMANVLNEFLNGVSKGFQDVAFASFKRRRSTVRADLDQAFQSSREDLENQENSQGNSAISGSADVTPSKGGGTRKVNLDELSEM